MQPSVYKIPLEAPGRLWIMPKPSAEWLAEDVAAYHLMGMSKIISLLARDEAEELGLREEAVHCGAVGLSFRHYPISDRGLAADSATFAALARETLGELTAGAAVGIHCRAGIGRSGMLACCILTLHGLSAEDAIARVSRARGVAVPDTDAQAAYIRGIAELGQRTPERGANGIFAC